MSEILEGFVERLTERDTHYYKKNCEQADKFAKDLMLLMEQAIKANPQHSRKFLVPWTLFDSGDYWQYSTDSPYDKRKMSIDEVLSLMTKMWATASKPPYKLVFTDTGDGEHFEVCLKSPIDMF